MIIGFGLSVYTLLSSDDIALVVAPSVTLVSHAVSAARTAAELALLPRHTASVPCDAAACAALRAALAVARAANRSTEPRIRPVLA